METRLSSEGKDHDLSSSGADNAEPRHIFIAVMGMTGVGKSSFVRILTGSDVPVGHGIESRTTTLSGYSFEHGQYVINLIDTPGFNDTNKSDTEILEEIAIWLNLTYRADVQLTGIIYLHRISDNRMARPAVTNLEMLQRLCGDHCLSNVILVTTMWSDLTQTQEFTAQEAREADLKSNSKYWGDLIHKGATTARYDGTYSSALNIVSHLERRPPIVLDIQRQMVYEGCTLMQTAAGRYLNEGFLAKEKELQLQLDVVRKDLVKAKQEEDEDRERDMENKKGELMMTLAQVEQTSQGLEVDIERKSKERERRIQNLAQQRRTSRSGSATAGAAKGLGMLGQAAMAMAGDLIPGGTIMIRAVRLGVSVLRLIFETVQDIQS